MTSAITTHVLDTSRGRPAAGLAVRLLTEDGTPVGEGRTDEHGRVSDLGPQSVDVGVYRLVLDTSAYFADLDADAFYPEISITFLVSNADEHYHVPVLLSPFGYSTYRGS